MKTACISSFLVFTIVSFGQSPCIECSSTTEFKTAALYVLDSTTTFLIDSAGNSSFWSRQIFEYNQQGIQTKSTTKNYGTGMWVNSIRSIDSINLDGTLHSRKFQEWIGNMWITSIYTDSIAYDNSKNLIYTQTRFAIGGALNPFEKTEHSYDSNNLPTLVKRYDWTSSSTDISDSTVYTNGAYGPITDTTWSWWFTDWLQTSNTQTSYDASGNVSGNTQQFNYQGVGQTPVWENYRKYSNMHDTNGNRNSTTYEYWVNGTWEKDKTEEYSFDYSVQNSNVWRSQQYLDFMNKVNDSKTYDYINGAKSLKDSTILHYTINANVGISEISIYELIAYPNPSNGVFKIADSNSIEELDYQVFNSMGQLVLESVKPVIDLSGMKEGVYYLLVSQGNVETKSIKLIVKNE
ncbi:MAG: T9SS type A sorting domain-containing protein [Schleiferiaceae bacterium]|jgi:hypothetical protein|nr:T9SS type A sorting domain-containing protein [Schleiferiaceae bacterium]